MDRNIYTVTTYFRINDAFVDAYAFLSRAAALANLAGLGLVHDAATDTYTGAGIVYARLARLPLLG